MIDFLKGFGGRLLSNFFDWHVWAVYMPMVIFFSVLMPAHNSAFAWLPASFGIYGTVLMFLLIAGDLLVTSYASRPVTNYALWGLTLFLSAGLGYYQQGWTTLVLLIAGRVANVILWNFTKRFDK